MERCVFKTFTHRLRINCTWTRGMWLRLVSVFSSGELMWYVCACVCVHCGWLAKQKLRRWLWECAHSRRDGTSGCSEGKYLPGTSWADVEGDFGLWFRAVGAAPLAELTARRNQASDPLHPQVIQVLWRETQRCWVRQRHRQSESKSDSKENSRLSTGEKIPVMNAYTVKQVCKC